MSLFPVELTQASMGQLRLASVSDVGSQSDLTGRYFENQSFMNANVHRSLVIRSTFSNCTFENSDFSRCDFQSANFSQCTFFNVTFRNADIHSVNFEGCTFSACDMSEAVISDTRFILCDLKKLNWEGAVISSIKSEGTTFDAIELHKSSFVHSEFNACTFKNMILGNCTFLYHMFSGCSFENIKINADSIGHQWGIEKKHLMSMKIIFLGEDQKIPDGPDFLSSVRESYANRNWYFASDIIELAYGDQHEIFLPNIAANHLFSPLGNSQPINVDEVKFFEKIIRKLHETGFLSGISLLTLGNQLSSVLQKLRKDNIRQPEIESFYANLTNFWDEEIASWSELHELFELSETHPNTEVLLTLVWGFRQKLDTVASIKWVAERLGGNDDNRVNLVSEKEGSWIEIVKVAISSAAGFLMTLRLVSAALTEIGCIKVKFEALQSPTKSSDLQVYKKSLIKKISGEKLNSIPAERMFNRLASTFMDDDSNDLAGDEVLKNFTRLHPGSLKKVEIDVKKEARNFHAE